MRQNDLAARIGVSEATVSLWFGGAVPEGWERLRKLCEELEISADHILGVGAVAQDRLEILREVEAVGVVTQELLADETVREALKDLLLEALKRRRAGSTALEGVPLDAAAKEQVLELKERLTRALQPGTSRKKR